MVFRVIESDKGARVREVEYDSLSRVARCSCLRFESGGIPCRHVLVVLRSCHVNEMSIYYLLPRWAKVSSDESCGQWFGMPTFPNGFYFGKLWAICTRFVVNAMRSEDAFSFASERLERYEFELNEYLSASPPMGCGASSVGSAKYADTITIHPPKMSMTKGSGRRIKEGKELAMERQKKRPCLCGACGLQAYHDSRNCPSKIES